MSPVPCASEIAEESAWSHNIVGAAPQSRTEEKRHTVRAAILLDSVAGLSDQAIARGQRVNRNTGILCIQKGLRFGVQAALGELPRSGKPRRVSDASIAWVQNCACQKPSHLRQNAGPAGYPELERVTRSKLHKNALHVTVRFM